MAKNVNENTTHVLFPPGVSYQSGLLSLESTPSEAVHLVSIDWLSACIGERKSIPEKDFEVQRYFVCFTHFTRYSPLVHSQLRILHFWLFDWLINSDYEPLVKSN